MALHTISLFSGVAMLDEGLRAGLAHLGIAHRTVCHYRYRESQASEQLMESVAWFSSEQGFNFWDGVHQMLKHMAKTGECK
jgi:hypothetical protein